MPFVSCNTFDASQAAQDAAILALQNGGAVTPAAVAGAVGAMTPAQLAAMCAALNCQPTTAALTSALLGLSGAGTSGNVLSIVGGAPVWQAPVAGSATSVPATGVTTGALPAGVTTTPASVTGFDAAALAAVPVSTDTVVGKSRSATPAEASAGTENDGVHISPADLLSAVTNAGAVRNAAAINPSQYGTAAQTTAIGAGAPTAAPTAANPATEVTNANGEVFRWNGTSWYLSGNGYLIDLAAAPTTTIANTSTFILSTALPRSGYVIATWNIAFSGSQNSLKYCALDIGGTAANANSGSSNNAPLGVYDSASGAVVFSVVAGQVATLSVYSSPSTNIDGARIHIKYI